MRSPALFLMVPLVAAACARPEAPPPLPTVTSSILATIGDSASTIEGIASYDGKLFVCDWKDGTIYRIDPASPEPVPVGGLPVPSGTAVLGMVTDAGGNLYLAVPDSGLVFRVAAGRLGAADFNRKRDATRFATGAAGANALVFDAGAGHLWISGGTTGAIYHVGPEGGPVATFATDVSPMSTDTTMPVRAYASNGLGFDSRGVLYSLNTGSGRITKLTIGPGYSLMSRQRWIQDPRILGADGLAFDGQGNLWVAANFRNSLVRVGPDGTLTLVAASVPTGVTTDSTMIPAYPQAGPGNALRAPAEIKLIGNTAYLANLNLPIGANAGQPVKGATVAAVTLP